MPLSFKEFTELLRGLPASTPQDKVIEAAHAAEAGTPLDHIWNTLNRPLAGSKDALIPALRHEHAPSESGLRTAAEDFGATLTSPVSLGTAALGVGGAAAGAKGLLGISKAARLAEAGLQLPMAAEGARKLVDGESTGEKVAGAAEAALAGAGVKNALTHAYEPTAVANAYLKSKGMVRPDRVATELDPSKAMRIADAYEAMPHNPGDPAVARSYSALKNETLDQFKFLSDKAGVKMEPWTGEGQPYKNSAEMTADIRKNNHLFYFPTEQGFGSTAAGAGNPMLDETEHGPTNDLFRAIHDYFGHAQNGNQFGPKGEEAAWNDHMSLFSREARPAMTTETRGQNSWVNFGPQMRDEKGALLAKDAPGFLRPQDRAFAPQKTGLLPAEFSETEVLPQGDELAAAQAVDATPRSAPSASATGQSTPPQLSLSPKLLAQINQQHATSGGSTTSLLDGRLVNDAKYVLSPYEQRQLILDHPPTEQDLRNYVAKNEDLLTQPGHNLGTWDNQGKHYLDVAITENDLNKALDLGKQHKQLAIYDMLNGKDVPIPSDEHIAAEQANIARNAPFGEGSIMPSAVKPTELLAAAAPSVAGSQIDDSDPNDPHQQLKHYAKLGLDLATMAGLGTTAIAAPIRRTAMAPMKAAAAKGAAYILLGGSKTDWAKRMLAEGVGKEELERVRAGAEKILSNQLTKTGNQMPNVRKLMAHFESGKAEMGWYDDVHKELGELFGKDADLMAKLLAATSTNSTVKSNTTLALKAYAKIKAGEPVTDGFLPVVVKQINRVIQGEPLEGRKIDNFAKAIVGDPNAVVVDRWMLRAFGFMNHDAATPHEYDVIEHAVKELAQKKGVTPRQMQASIWFSVKNQAEKGQGRPESPAYGKLLKEKLANQSLPF
jgi:hypothetical protein